jgi:energy-coupling factor transporter ATP-binding protein EcfA2
MKVTRLKLANARAVEAAEFHFRPGFNLIVGVNGVGKTTVLDALCVCLAAVIKRTNRIRMPPAYFAVDDIRGGADALTIECGIALGANEYSYLIHKPRETSAAREKKAGMPREQVHDTPEKEGFIGETPSPATGKEIGGRPLAVLFSTNRAVPSERAPRKGVSAGGFAAAFGDALTSRELRLGQFVDWMRVQETLKGDSPAARRVLLAFEKSVERFLPGYRHLRVNVGRHPTLLIDRGSVTVAVRQLSDGERGTLALVLDLTRRLAQANPGMEDPAAASEAVVLVDEIDLHLHPKWQRQIVHNLTSAFPQCQFIATTHSPQVIGEVEHDRIQIMADGQVYSPSYSLGVDSSRVLEEIMDADPRSQEVKTLLARISAEVGKQRYERARDLLVELVSRLGDDDPEVTRIRTLLDFIAGER